MTTRVSVSMLLSALAFGAASVLPTPARASTAFPEHIQKTLGAPCAPQCTLCHTDNVGGLGTISKPFGIEAQKAGATAALTTNLDVAFAKLNMPLTTADGVKRDVDLDGKQDIQELIAGTDPNLNAALVVGGDEALCGTGPTYGCGARIARTPKTADNAATAAAVLTALVGLLALRRRRG